jgi:ERCC4-related helicase
VINNLGISRIEHRGEEHAEVAMYTHTKEKVLIQVTATANVLTIILTKVLVSNSDLGCNRDHAPHSATMKSSGQFLCWGLEATEIMQS